MNQPLQKHIRAGHFVFKEGDSSQEVYVIKQGRVAILKKKANEQIELAQLGERAVFGEMSLIDGNPRSASAQAIEDTILHSIAPHAFHFHIKQLPSWLQTIVQVVSQRLRKSNDKKLLVSVQQNLESLKLFLWIKSQNGARSYNYSCVIKEFSAVSRATPKTIELHLDELCKQKIITISSQYEIKLLDIQALKPHSLKEGAQ